MKRLIVIAAVICGFSVYGQTAHAQWAFCSPPNAKKCQMDWLPAGQYICKKGVGGWFWTYAGQCTQIKNRTKHS